MIVIWVAIALLVGTALWVLTTGSGAVMTWLGVFLMFLALGGVVTFVGLAWYDTRRQLQGDRTEDA